MNQASAETIGGRYRQLLNVLGRAKCGGGWREETEYLVKALGSSKNESFWAWTAKISKTLSTHRECFPARWDYGVLDIADVLICA